MRRFNAVSYIILLALLLTLAGCRFDAGLGSDAGKVSRILEGPLGTVSTVTLYDWEGGEEPIDDVFNMLLDIDARMSALSEGSETVEISDGAGTPVRVSKDTFELIEYAKNISVDVGGAFDITICPVTDLWGIGRADARVPEQSEIADALELVDYNGIILDSTAHTVMLEKEGMRLDLGAIAKGYACDEAVEILKAADVGPAIIDFGRNVYVHGTKPDGTRWRVGVTNPIVGENGYFGILEASDKAIVTSGVYERFFESDGKLYHHIMDPQTGYPVDNGLVSVTIICEAAVQADALSTACFVLGAERGMEYLSTFFGVEGIFVSDDLTVLTTQGLKDCFKITDLRFTWAE